MYARYFNEVGRTTIPASALEERILFYRYQELGDRRARDQLVRGNLRFVIKTARQYYRGDTEFLKTLIAAGNVGLLHAVDRYCQWVIECHYCAHDNYVPVRARQRCKQCGKPLRKRNARRYSTRFLTYAHWWITEAIHTELYNSSLVRIPPYKQKEHNRARREGKTIGPTYVSYDESEPAAPLNSNATVLRLTADTQIEHELINGHAAKLLHELLRALSPRDAYVLIAYYGLREAPKNLREIAATLGICAERVRQIKEHGMAELRRRLQRRRIHSTSDAFD